MMGGDSANARLENHVCEILAPLIDVHTDRQERRCFVFGKVIEGKAV